MFISIWLLWFSYRFKYMYAILNLAVVIFNLLLSLRLFSCKTLLYLILLFVSLFTFAVFCSLYMFPARSEIWSYSSGYFDRFSSALCLYNAVSEGHAQKNLQLDKIAQMEYAINNCELWIKLPKSFSKKSEICRFLFRPTSEQCLWLGIWSSVFQKPVPISLNAKPCSKIMHEAMVFKNAPGDLWVNP